MLSCRHSAQDFYLFGVLQMEELSILAAAASEGKVEIKTKRDHKRRKKPTRILNSVLLPRMPAGTQRSEFFAVDQYNPDAYADVQVKHIRYVFHPETGTRFFCLSDLVEVATGTTRGGARYSQKARMGNMMWAQFERDEGQRLFKAQLAVNEAGFQDIVRSITRKTYITAFKYVAQELQDWQSKHTVEKAIVSREQWITVAISDLEST